MRDLEGRTALVTGASSGLGVSFARALAARGARVVVTARRLERLEALAAELRKDHSVDAVAIASDLASPGGARALLRELDERELAIDVLVNNAGGGKQAFFLASDWESVRAQIQLNVTSLVELTHSLAARMAERGRGHVLNVASIGAYLPVPGYATYAASKALVRGFSEAVAQELAGSGVRVCCLCPGGIDTEFFDAAGQRVSWWLKLGLMSPDRCARIGLRALFGCRRNVVSGLSNALAVFLMRFAPRYLITRIAGALMGPSRALPAR